MRHEDATAAIDAVISWFGGPPSEGSHVDAKVSKIIATILRAQQLGNFLHDHGRVEEGSHVDHTDLMWAIVKACDITALEAALAKAVTRANEIEEERLSKLEP